MRYTFLLFSLCLAFIGLQSCRNASTSHKRNHSQYGGYDNSSKNRTSRNKTHISGVKIQDSRNKKLDGASIYKMYNTAVFMVFTSDGVKGYQGSGFFIDARGLAVSNYHVFEGTNIGNEQIKLPGSDNLYKVTDVIFKNKECDFIIFRVNVPQSNFIPLAKERPQVGEKVYAIGSPRGLENTFSSGEVSQWRDTNLMQISALIDHGSSGGALINEYGAVVGITSGSFYDGSQANLNYAWSIEVIKECLR